MVWRVRIKSREPEWIVAAYTFLYGLVLSQPGLSMVSPSFRTLLGLMPEDRWASLFLMVGALHLLALGVNGAGAWTPFARAIAASVNLVAYAAIVSGLYVENTLSPGVPTYGLVCALLIFILSRASRDCFLSRRLKHGTL